MIEWQYLCRRGLFFALFLGLKRLLFDTEGGTMPYGKFIERML